MDMLPLLVYPGWRVLWTLLLYSSAHTSRIVPHPLCRSRPLRRCHTADDVVPPTFRSEEQGSRVDPGNGGAETTEITEKEE